MEAIGILIVLGIMIVMAARTTPKQPTAARPPKWKPGRDE